MTADTTANAALMRGGTDEPKRTATAGLFYSDTFGGGGAPADRPYILMCQKWVKDLINTVVPLGTIVMWHPYIAVPAGWTICDGHAPYAGELIQTPNLQAQFITGAIPGHVTHSPGMTGGTWVHQHGLSINGTELTVSQMPNHAHGTNGSQFDTIVGRHNPGGTIIMNTGGVNSGYQVLAITSTGGTYEGSNGAPHNHTGIATDGSSIPPFMALLYICKVKYA